MKGLALFVILHLATEAAENAHDCCFVTVRRYGALETNANSQKQKYWKIKIILLFSINISEDGPTFC